MERVIAKPRLHVFELSFLLILIGFTWAFYRVMAPFVLNIFLAVIFANICWRPFSYLRAVLGDRAVPAAAVTVLTAFVLLAIPISVIGLLIYHEAVEGYARVQELWPELGNGLENVDVRAWLERLPVVGGMLGDGPPVELGDAVRGVFEFGSDFVVEMSRRSFVSITSALVNSVLILFLMFFLLLDGERIVERLYAAIPLPDSYLRQLAEETIRTTGATLASTVIIGMIEGAYGALLLRLFGLPSPLLWGVIIMILSMIPLIGTNLVLTPAGIILMLSGNVVGGMALALLGYGGVAVTQNIVRPKLLGDRSGLHPAMVLLATIGGIAWLGLVGFLIGPLIASLFVAVWSQFVRFYKSQYADKNSTRGRPARKRRISTSPPSPGRLPVRPRAAGADARSAHR
ncbi:MAG: AI-2E family transporter [Spirochaetaceae bacterium]|nr:MAG: AI-2E family transporter [Spirochaetaceae bacterium]